MVESRAWYFRQLHRRPALWLAWAAAVLYSSWPLGYLLNPSVGKHDLASQLEALHQPYAWVFISMDILTGVAVGVAGALQLRGHAKRDWLPWCTLNYVLFGFFNAVAAISPLNCNPEANACGPVFRDPILILHVAASILSLVFLGLGIISSAVVLYREHMGRLGGWLFGGIAAAWTISGIGTVIEFFMHITGNTLQYYFITVCSLSVVLVIGTVEHLHLTGRRKQTGSKDI